MDRLRKKYRYSIVFLLLCLIVLFMPKIGDVRWVGLIGFLYVALPWYILSLKDLVQKRVELQEGSDRNIKLYSITLLLFGMLCLFLGVTIDLVIINEIYNDPKPMNLVSAITRLLFGLPFFGFGIYLTNLAMGKRT